MRIHIENNPGSHVPHIEELVMSLGVKLSGLVPDENDALVGVVDESVELRLVLELYEGVDDILRRPATAADELLAGLLHQVAALLAGRGPVLDEPDARRLVARSELVASDLSAAADFEGTGEGASVWSAAAALVRFIKLLSIRSPLPADGQLSELLDAVADLINETRGISTGRGPCRAWPRAT